MLPPAVIEQIRDELSPLIGEVRAKWFAEAMAADADPSIWVVLWAQRYRNLARFAQKLAKELNERRARNP